jgi:Protein of unknown function (DUF2510)
MLQDRPFWRRHPWVSAGAVLLAVWLLADGWYATVAALTTAVALVTVRRRRRAMALRDAGLRARADYEHRLNLAGDPRGIFGRYPPVPAGWFPDPQNRCPMRFLDGAVWTPYAAPAHTSGQ